MRRIQAYLDSRCPFSTWTERPESEGGWLSVYSQGVVPQYRSIRSWRISREQPPDHLRLGGNVLCSNDHFGARILRAAAEYLLEGARSCEGRRSRKQPKMDALRECKEETQEAQGREEKIRWVKVR